MEFKPEYVRCTWSPELEGKEVIFSDSLDGLWEYVVNDNDHRTTCEKGMTDNYPFKCDTQGWRFVYYDPNYSLKIAHEQGMKIECKKKGDIWKDWGYIPSPTWLDDYEYRIMPEECNPVTHRDMSRWLSQGNGEYTEKGLRDTSINCYANFNYPSLFQDEPIPDSFLIRKWDDDEWHSPTREYMGLNTQEV